MSQYKHLLVGLDLGKDCEKILNKAVALAETLDAKISLLHAFEPLAFAYGGDVPIDLSQAQDLMEQQATKRLSKIAQPFGIPLERQYVRIGQTSSELHYIAEQEGADLIIVGSHARHGLAALFGNTAGGVIRGAECDVMAVKV
ncbi:MAG: universal stress protein [Agarilytica sp.]